MGTFGDATRAQLEEALERTWKYTWRYLVGDGARELAMVDLAGRELAASSAWELAGERPSGS
jgi:hypothetical protein